MLNRNRIVVCDDCFFCLCKRHYPLLAKMWLFFAEESYEGLRSLTEEEYIAFSQEIEILEKNGFIVSHEIKSGVILKFFGFDSSSNSFCVKKHDAELWH